MLDKQVHHSKYGRGIVKQTRHKGFELNVVFENGLTQWIRFDEVTQNEVNDKKHQVEAAVIPPDESRKCRKMIEAFRLGIVPYDSVEDFTFGRDEEVSTVIDWLKSSKENTLLIVGGYGTGKTHLLHHACARALQEGFAVAWVEMDPNEAPFHKPKRVYNHLIKTLKYRCTQSGRLLGFRNFLRYAINRGAFKDHPYFRYLIDQNDEIIWEWIEGSEAPPRPIEWINEPWGYRINSYPHLPGLYDYSTAANIYCNLLSGLGWVAKNVLKLKGLLLVFDEAETINMYHYYYQAARSQNFVNALIRVAEDEKSLCLSPQKSGLVFCRTGVASSVPFSYKVPCGIKLLFASTPAVSYSDDLKGHASIILSPLSDGALKEIFDHICLVYDSAYDFLNEDIIIDRIFHMVNTQSGRTRLFVKGAVEALDLVRLHPNKPFGEVLQA